MTTAVHHDHDFYSWAMRNAQLLREGRLAEIDCEYVAEELEDMGAAKERELESRLGVCRTNALYKMHTTQKETLSG
jgi:hypothetical protein